jgi:hypothetical protein
MRKGPHFEIASAEIRSVSWHILVAHSQTLGADSMDAAFKEGVTDTSPGRRMRLVNMSIFNAYVRKGDVFIINPSESAQVSSA